MLSTLGHRAGVRRRLVAARPSSPPVFVLAVLFVIESFEKATLLFALTVKAKDVSELRPRVERLLQSNRMKYEVRRSHRKSWPTTCGCRSAARPIACRSRFSTSIARTVGVQWEEKKGKESRLAS
jgi:hypothetical protein